MLCCDVMFSEVIEGMMMIHSARILGMVTSFMLGFEVSKVASGSVGEENRKPHRFKPGTQVLREIRHLQKTVDMLISVALFIRIVRSLCLGGCVDFFV
ncbi:putative transcription factor Hap3/NF-YB family [Helianthus annuus]|nr:putative transcription factor Hap3/NF-YB family [Helianthus annuus]